MMNICLMLNSQEESKKSLCLWRFFLLFFTTHHRNNFKGSKTSTASLRPVKPYLCSSYTLKPLKIAYREPESLWGVRRHRRCREVSLRTVRASLKISPRDWGAGGCDLLGFRVFFGVGFLYLIQ